MVAKTTDEHFAQYAPNTRIKHEILARYLDAYLKALSNSADAFHYIDGFAGRGYYGGVAPGSPLRALDLLDQQRLPYCASFVEASRPDADDLRRAIAARATSGAQVEAPVVLDGEFAAHINDVLARPALAKYKRVATFAFVDPCRVKGVRIPDLKKILDAPYGECLVFWNYDGINRWLGAISAGSNDSGLKDYFGSTIVLKQALALADASAAPEEKEKALLGLTLETIQKYSGASHLLPFRFTARDADRTSHYLIHCSRHGLAFRLMKQVMSSVSSSGEPGRFEFLGEADLGSQADMFRPAPEQTAAARILEELGTGEKPVMLFLKTWTQRPDDFLTPADYQRILLNMEARGAVDVLEPVSMVPAPAAGRRRSKGGQPTLGERYWVRLGKHSALSPGIQNQHDLPWDK